MELSDLNVFKEVAQLGGITLAAKKLNRVPSNITTRIQKLERELGKKLFIREKNRLRISTAGEQLLSYAEQILDLAEQAVTDLGQDQPKGPLKLGAMEAVAATRLVEPLMCFHQRFTEVSLNVKCANTGELIDWVLSGELDMAFVADPVADPRLGILPAYKETLVLVSALGHRPIQQPCDLGPEATLLGFSHRCVYRNRLTEWLNQGGNITKVIEINSYHALLSCVAAGMGVGVVPKALLEYYHFRENIQMHTLPQPWSQSQTALIWRHDSLKASMSAFIDCLKN
ncbi:LysR family transcriptional regulator [Sinobacterium caligoides]|uniref:LysR family transcriptional regulator n=1 Tax=Sinobacterium caligoides TaxID=933926 RepID=A0A3N2DNA9_9GAMM|nr:LysR family transcriptional regulator [Sinobacterium caligoides]ROS01294.1 LysR family transcriptional regulator [Sinobacterium caligoides]